MEDHLDLPLSSPVPPRGDALSGGDQEACEPIGKIGTANFRPLPPEHRSALAFRLPQGTSRITFGSLISRTDSAVIVPLPMVPRAVKEPVWALPVVSMRACTETV